MLISRYPPRYCAWLLRCGPAPDAPGAVGGAWRFSLEDPHTGERHAFTGLDALVAFLRAELALGCDPPPDDAPAVADPAGNSAES